MDDDDTLYPIGELARRTGLPVKTVRFYSDSGIVPPTDRSPAGYRLYDIDAVARLDLVRTLRDLGLDLATIRKVLDREASLRDVAAAHAEALRVQIRALRLRRAVLTVVAGRGAGLEETTLMNKLARYSDQERRDLIDRFLDDMFGGLDANPDFVAMLRQMRPDLPDDPAPAQVEAWVELAELTQDPDFRAAMRTMAEYQAAERRDGDATGLHQELTRTVVGLVGRAVADGVDPDSPRADPVVTALLAEYARVFGRADDAALPVWILNRLEVANDPRAERYWQLLSVINGWPVPESVVPVFEWYIAALRARVGVQG